jgi:hypothetical protein
MPDPESAKSIVSPPDHKGFWESSFGASLRTQTATWFVGALIALLSVFSSRLTESVKFSINKADIRAKSYEEIAQGLSEYLFIAGQFQETLERGTTTKEALVPIVMEYNDAITKLNRNEYVYRSWLARYWNKADMAKFDEVMMSINNVDQSVHSLNDQLELVNITKSQTKIDPGRAAKCVEQMRPLQAKLRGQVRQLLEDSL